MLSLIIEAAEEAESCQTTISSPCLSIFPIMDWSQFSRGGAGQAWLYDDVDISVSEQMVPSLPSPCMPLFVLLLWLQIFIPFVQIVKHFGT